MEIESGMDDLLSMTLEHQVVSGLTPDGCRSSGLLYSLRMLSTNATKHGNGYSIEADSILREEHDRQLREVMKSEAAAFRDELPAVPSLAHAPQISFADLCKSIPGLSSKSPKQVQYFHVESLQAALVAKSSAQPPSSHNGRARPAVVAAAVASTVIDLSGPDEAPPPPVAANVVPSGFEPPPSSHFSSSSSSSCSSSIVAGGHPAARPLSRGPTDAPISSGSSVQPRPGAFNIGAGSNPHGGSINANSNASALAISNRIFHGVPMPHGGGGGALIGGGVGGAGAAVGGYNGTGTGGYTAVGGGGFRPMLPNQQHHNYHHHPQGDGFSEADDGAMGQAKRTAVGSKRQLPGGGSSDDDGDGESRADKLKGAFKTGLGQPALPRDNGYSNNGYGSNSGGMGYGQRGGYGGGAASTAAAGGGIGAMGMRRGPGPSGGVGGQFKPPRRLNQRGGPGPGGYGNGGGSNGGGGGFDRPPEPGLGPGGQGSILQRYGPDATHAHEVPVERWPINPATGVRAEPGQGVLPEHMQGVDLTQADDFCRNDVYRGEKVDFTSIAGLVKVKQEIYQSVVMPLQNAHLMSGPTGSKLLEMPKGILLFGPPGTGKTLLAKAAASSLGATFFSISAGSIGSKWHGESEKMVKSLFAAAREYEPSILFIDEIDSLLTQRKDNESEVTGKVKTQFLIEMDGANRKADSKVIVMGATNRPDLLDEAVRRRFQRRILIPLPDVVARRQLLDKCLADHGNVAVSENVRKAFADQTEGYSGDDITNIMKQAAALCMEKFAERKAREAMAGMSTSRQAAIEDDGVGGAKSRVAQLSSAANIGETDPIKPSHINAALARFKPSVSPADVARHEAFAAQFGWKSAVEATKSSGAADDDEWTDDEDEDGNVQRVRRSELRR